MQFFVFLLPSCLSIKGFYICWLKSKTSYTNNVHVNAPIETKKCQHKKTKIKSHRLCETSIFDNKVVENLKYSQQSICITVSPRSNCYDIIHSKGVLNFVLNWTEIKELRKYTLRGYNWTVVSIELLIFILHTLARQVINWSSI